MSAEAFGYYPVTIISTRYGGSYEDGDWAAFLCDPQQVPDDATGNDLECSAFWASIQDGTGEWAGLVAVGDSPVAALQALARTVSAEGR